MPANEPTPIQEAQIEHEVDTRGISYALARASVIGEKISSPDEATSDAPKESASVRKKLPGKPITYPKPGYVRDFHDGGRSNEDRNGHFPPAPEEVLSMLRTGRDKIVFDNIVADYQEAREDDFQKLDSHRSRAIGRWRAHIEKHYSQLGEEAVKDLLQEMKDVLAIS